MTQTTDAMNNYLGAIDDAHRAMNRLKDQQYGLRSDFERIAKALRSMASISTANRFENGTSASSFRE